MVTIKQFENATGNTETIEMADMELEDVETPARMIGRVYEAFATGGQYPTFEDALENHRRLDGIAKGALPLKGMRRDRCCRGSEARREKRNSSR